MAASSVVDVTGFVLAAHLVAAAACPAAAQTTERNSIPERPEAVAVRAARGVVPVIASGYVEAESSMSMRLERIAESGAIVDASGYILTTAHLVADAVRVDVVLPAPEGITASAFDEEKTVQAEVVGVMGDLDLALLRVPVRDLPALTLATSAVHPGELAITVAATGPSEHAVAVGQVLAAGAAVREGSPVPYLVTDATPTIAGSAIVNRAGELIGLTAAFEPLPGHEVSPTAALPAALLEAAYDQLREGDRHQRGVVGLAARTVSAREASTTGTSPQALLVVSAVAPGLPAAQAGVLPGDVIVSINRRPIEGMELATLYLSLFTLREGDAIVLGIDRNGQHVDVSPTAVALRDELATR